jgi:hypothetical protein
MTPKTRSHLRLLAEATGLPSLRRLEEIRVRLESTSGDLNPGGGASMVPIVTSADLYSSALPLSETATWTDNPDGSYTHTAGAVLRKQAKDWVLTYKGKTVKLPKRATFDHAEAAMRTIDRQRGTS